jgi:SAM-dependent methyltransferase
MTRATDQEYLLSQQYHNGARLSVRGRLHARFRTNPDGWFAWMFDQMRIAPESRILELGCGLGWLWLRNRARIPAGWDITLSDFSQGMLAETQQRLQDVPHQFAYAVVDAQAIPYPDASFDAVIADHMLYHVPDRARAIAEVRRVLKPGGRFYASTISREHFRALAALVSGHAPDDAMVDQRFPFNLENGGAQLAASFAHVTLHRHEDTLVVTEAGPLVAYLASLSSMSASDTTTDTTEAALAALTSRLQTLITAEGAIRIPNDAGLFEAW